MCSHISLVLQKVLHLQFGVSQLYLMFLYRCAFKRISTSVSLLVSRCLQMAF